MKVTNNLYIHKTIFYYSEKTTIKYKTFRGDKRQIYSFGLFK